MKLKPEQIFGLNAGKVWQVLKNKGASSVAAIAKEAHLKANDVFAALGWLGKEGKIEILEDKKGTLYKLI